MQHDQDIKRYTKGVHKYFIVTYESVVCTYGTAKCGERWERGSKHAPGPRRQFGNKGECKGSVRPKDQPILTRRDSNNGARQKEHTSVLSIETMP